ncbi:MAG: SpaH/EbpB family LPXTG-anchored major pilin [Clostridia bacterium]|nr:SpaH/EbpB family LPXTG-anchored major pilin [Clostridia bacterium]
MKLSNKLLSMALVLMMILAIAVPAFAVVVKASTTTTLSIEDKVFDPENPGQRPNATVSVKDSQGNEIDLTDESNGYIQFVHTEDTFDSASYGLPTDPGTYKCYARYSGNENYESSTSEIVEVTIYAAAETEGDFEIQVKTEKTDRLYEAYQILTGTPARDEEGNIILSDITWGKCITSEGIEFLEDLYVLSLDLEEGEEVPAFTTYDVIKFAMGNFTPQELGMTLGRYLNKSEKYLCVADDFDASIPGYSITTEEAGYYLVRETKDSLDGEHASATWFLLGAVDANEPTVLEPKEPTDPIVDKFVSNTTGDLIDAEWSEEVSANYHENVTFRLDATFPFNYVQEGGWEKIEFEDFDVYSFTLHDSLPYGLDYAGNLQVFTNGYFGQAIDPAYYTVNVEPMKDGSTVITIHFDDLSAVEYFWEPDSYDRQYPPVLSSINVVFEARVSDETDDSVRTNVVYATYPNDPNHPEEEDGKTPEADASVVVYALEILKVDAETGAALNGATFQLYKLNADGSKNYLAEYNPSAAGEESILSWLGANENAVSFTTDENGLIVIKGLAEGTYYLEETKAPTGYNKLTAPVEVKLGENKDLKTVQITVENEKGLVLPSTGGMGTTLLYALGAVLLLGGAVLIYSKRRVEE